MVKGVYLLELDNKRITKMMLAVSNAKTTLLLSLYGKEITLIKTRLFTYKHVSSLRISSNLA